MEMYPTITLHCSCGQRLYTVSINVGGLTLEFNCKQCMKHYELINSLVPKWDVRLKQEESPSIHNDHIAAETGSPLPCPV